MAVLIWSEKSQAFVEPENIMVPEPSGALVSAPAARIKDGEAWIDVYPSKKYLYRAGDECNGITGGWEVWRYISDYWLSGGIAKNENGILSISVATTASYPTYYGVMAGFTTKNTIDVTKYKKICVTLKSAKVGGASSDGCVIYTTPIKPQNTTLGQYASHLLIKDTLSSYQTVENDISSTTGSLYVVLRGQIEKIGTNSSTNIEIKEVWLE